MNSRKAPQARTVQVSEPLLLVLVVFFLQVPFDLEHGGVEREGFELGTRGDAAVFGGDEAFDAGGEGGVDEEGLGVDGGAGYGGDEGVDAGEGGGEGGEGGEVCFADGDAGVVGVGLLGAGEDGDLEVCVEEGFEDVGAEIACCLGEVVRYFSFCVRWGG